MNPDDKRIMEYRKFQVAISFDEHEQRFRGEITPSCEMTPVHGDSIEEVRQAFVQAVDRHHHKATLEAYERTRENYDEVFSELAKS